MGRRSSARLFLQSQSLTRHFGNPHAIALFVLTEGITAMDRVSQYAKIGETTLFEIRVEMVLQFSSRFEPTIVDDFNTMHVTTEFPDKAHADAGTPQIIREYDIPQNLRAAKAAKPQAEEGEHDARIVQLNTR